MLTRLAPLLLVLSGLGCRRAPPPDTRASAPAPDVAAPKAPAAPPPTVKIERETTIRESGGLVAGRIDGARRAFIADEDDAAIVEVDLEKEVFVRSTPIGSRPRDLVLLPDGTLAATLPDAAAIAVFAREVNGTLRELKRVATPTEPIAMGLSPDDAELFVTTGASHTLVRLSTSTMKEGARWDLGREPRAVLVSNDAKRVFVTHAIDTNVSIVQLGDEAEPIRRDIGEGQFCSSFGPCIPRRHARNAQAIVRIGERGVVIPAAQSLPNPPLSMDDFTPKPMPPMFPGGPSESEPVPGFTGYGVGGSGGPPIRMDVATLDAADGTLVKAGVLRTGTSCNLPRAAIAVKDRVLIACLGSGHIEELENPHGRPAMAVLHGTTSVPAGPTALATERDEKHVLVWSAFARQLSRIPTDVEGRRLPTKHATTMAQRRGLASDPSVKIPIPRTIEREKAWLRGRELFFSNTDTRVSGDGRACASCHVDGRDDGITWQTPMGPRRTRLLAGQLESGPYGWRGEHSTLEIHVKTTFRQLRGTGLPDDELASLLTYVRSLPKPPVHAPSDKANDVARGKDLFASAECGNCHSAGGSDRNVHDVGTGGSFMTPTLAGIGTRKQMMHDGRYATLDELLAGAKAMGAGSNLSSDDRRSLVTYLETL